MLSLDERLVDWMKTFHYGRYAEAVWRSGIVSLVAAIHECKGRQEAFLAGEPAVLRKLSATAEVQSVESSNRIEGIVTSKARSRELCDEKATPANQSEKEIAGYREALKTIREHFMDIPLTSNFILQLHGLLYRYAESGIGGRFKNVQNYIQETRADGTNIIRFTPLAPSHRPLSCRSWGGLAPAASWKSSAAASRPFRTTFRFFRRPASWRRGRTGTGFFTA